MKKEAFKLLIFPLILLLFSDNITWSQGTDSRSLTRKAGKMYAGINLIPKMAVIKNGDFSSDTLEIKNGGSFDISAEAGYFFSENLGVSIGAGFNSFSTKLSLASYSTRFTTLDSENETYQMQVSGKTITEDQKLGLLSIPVCLIFRYPMSEKLNLMVNGGASINLPMVNSYKGGGIFTYKGYYPAYPVLIENYPDYFPADLQTNSSGTLQIKSMFMCLTASAGASFSLNESLNLGIGFYFTRSLGSISEYKPARDFKLSSEKNELNSFMSAGKSSGVQSVGLRISFKYYLK